MIKTVVLLLFYMTTAGTVETIPVATFADSNSCREAAGVLLSKAAASGAKPGDLSVVCVETDLLPRSGV